ncbi:DUF1192 domain-containing protein [Falsiroseomonas tokyonensis]|uniref:DUF1192 domain-containing protein n=1 Tax=Falsiroseomonas tokyonensis TaxID=430521 RepID=A0ABV7C572_9PROT|nr:DUF1192 domain-containing protein [Falsiroseomonas tokyonensis]MBU8541567.1 DUF1192 domain-containing protein [Falsiroseomonas tokyonensis]
MFLEEETPKPKGRFERPVMDRWDVDELRAYIEELRSEIARAEAEIGKRQAGRAAADLFFKVPPLG